MSVQAGAEYNQNPSVLSSVKQESEQPSTKVQGAMPAEALRDTWFAKLDWRDDERTEHLGGNVHANHQVKRSSQDSSTGSGVKGAAANKKKK